MMRRRQISVLQAWASDRKRCPCLPAIQGYRKSNTVPHLAIRRFDDATAISRDVSELKQPST